MVNLSYTKIQDGLDTWIGFAENARSYLVAGTIPTDVSQILEYCKVALLNIFNSLATHNICCIHVCYASSHVNRSKYQLPLISKGLCQCFGQCCCKKSILRKQVTIKRQPKKIRVLIGLIFGLIFALWV